MLGQTVETAKQLASNELSMEQQLYYKVRIVFPSYGVCLLVSDLLYFLIIGQYLE